jgi:hypothetical protein
LEVDPAGVSVGVSDVGAAAGATTPCGVAVSVGVPVLDALVEGGGDELAGGGVVHSGS